METPDDPEMATAAAKLESHLDQQWESAGDLLFLTCGMWGHAKALAFRQALVEYDGLTRAIEIAGGHNMIQSLAILAFDELQVRIARKLQEQGG